MLIEEEMINLFFLPYKLQMEILQKYLEYPANNKVTEGAIEKHGIGDARHYDFRFAVNDHLIGMAVVGFSKDDPPTMDKLIPGRGFRAEEKCKSEYCNEWKFDIYEKDGEYYYLIKSKEELSELTREDLARQPKTWLFKKQPIGKTFTFKPGEVGAGVEAPGEMTVLDRLQVKFGTLKPYFLEYFVKGRTWKEWTRLVFRRVRGRKLDPRTKQPTEKKVAFWKFMVAKDSTPYAISRGIKKGWRPPKGIIPFPEDWVKKIFPEKYNKWLEYMKTRKEELSNIRFTLSLASWMGPPHIRKMPEFRWYLFLDEKKAGGIRTFKIEGNPLRERNIAVWEMNRVNKKWLDYKGRVGPETPFIETKELPGRMEIIDSGTVDYNSIMENKREIIKLNFKGKKLRAKWDIKQEEPKSDWYTMKKLSLVELTKGRFVFHKHTIKGKSHWDIKIKLSNIPYLIEWNLYSYPSESEVPIKAILKKCYTPEKWFITKGKSVKRNIGRLETYVDVLDTGTITIYELNPNFISMSFNGKKLKGYHVLKRENKQFYFIKSKLPRPSKLSEWLQNRGDPKTGNWMKDLPVEEKKGWNYFIIHLYDIRKFTRCVSQDKVKKYLQGIPSGVIVGICSYSRVGTLPGMRVAYVKFSKEQWDYNKAESWVKNKKLGEWLATQIREKRE